MHARFIYCFSYKTNKTAADIRYNDRNNRGAFPFQIVFLKRRTCNSRKYETELYGCRGMRIHLYPLRRLYILCESGRSCRQMIAFDSRRVI